MTHSSFTAPLFRLRCRYIKRGRLALLSHLEVAGALERAVRRAQLPFAVSQGFSPHMKIAFGSALPVGVGSNCELFDLLLTQKLDADHALRLLRAASTEDLMIQECFYIDRKAAAASVAFPLSTYEACFNSALESIEVPETITLVRKRKEKTLTVSDFLVSPPEIDHDRVRFTLQTKPTGSLRADVFIDACQCTSELVSLTRISQDSLPESS